MSVKEVTETLLDKIGFGSLRGDIAQLRKKFDAARSQIETLKRAREDLLALPVARADLYAVVDGLIDNIATPYQAQIREIMATLSRDPDGLATVCNRRWHSDLLSLNMSHLHPHARDLQEAAAAGALALMVGPDVIKAALHREIDAAVPDGGITSAERTRKLAQIDAQIDALENEYEKLRDAAHAAGLALI